MCRFVFALSIKPLFTVDEIRIDGALNLVLSDAVRKLPVSLRVSKRLKYIPVRGHCLMFSVQCPFQQ